MVVYVLIYTEGKTASSSLLNETTKKTMFLDDFPETFFGISFLAIYMIMTNVLLLNLLIAMFRYETQADVILWEERTKDYQSTYGQSDE